MNRIIITTLILATAGLVSCENKANDVELDSTNVAELEVTQVPEVETPKFDPMNKANVVARLISREPSDSAGMTEDATLLYNNFGEVEARDISNNLWAGSNGLPRNRRAAGAIAAIAFENSPQDWSTVRAGIAYVNSLGVEQNASKAISILSDANLSESSAAQFFLAKAYQLDNQNIKAKSHFEKAAKMGHRLAKEELTKQNY